MYAQLLGLCLCVVLGYIFKMQGGSLARKLNVCLISAQRNIMTLTDKNLVDDLYKIDALLRK